MEAFLVCDYCGDPITESETHYETYSFINHRVLCVDEQCVVEYAMESLEKQ